MQASNHQHSGDQPRHDRRGGSPRIATVPVDAAAQARRVVTAKLDWRRTFVAFRHRNYRLFFAGQLVSLIGTWMQTVALGWLVYDLTHSPFLLGLITFLSGLPMTLLTMPAGVIADRVPKRAVLIVTQTAAMLLAFALAALTYWKVVTVWHVALIGFLLGVTNAFDMPTRQSFVVDMVGKDNLMNAIALNSSMFNGARVLGPALAGVLIATVGEAGCFFLNGLSFLAVIVAYLAMRLPPTVPQSVTRSLKRETLEAVHYVWGNRVIRATVLLMAVVSLFALPYGILMPVFARDILKAGPTGLGYLVSANGVGALLGALTLAAIGDMPHYRRLFVGGLLGFTTMMFAFAFSQTLWLSALLLLGAGWAMTISFATANTVVQLRTPDELRGRVMGIYVLAFIGLGPFGSLLAGAIARATSTPFAVAFGAAVCAIATLIVARLLPRESAPAA